MTTLRLMTFALTGLAAFASAPARADSVVAIKFATLKRGEIQLLMSERDVRTRCFWGRHGCSSEQRTARLYALEVAAGERWVGATSMRQRWRKLRSAGASDRFDRLAIIGDSLVEFGEDVAIMCPLTFDVAACRRASVPASTYRVGPASRDPGLLVEGKIFHPPDVTAKLDLSERPGYRAFLHQVAGRELAHPRIATLIGTVGPRFVVAMLGFARGEDRTIADCYDVQGDRSFDVEFDGLPPDDSAELLDVAAVGSDLLFLARQFRYDRSTMELAFERHLIYSARDRRVIELPDLLGSTSNHRIWDAPNDRFILVDWNSLRNGIDLNVLDYSFDPTTP